MTRLRITHGLRYDLSPPVLGATLSARLEPRADPGQTVERSELSVTPPGSARSALRDEHGNRVEHIEIAGPISSIHLVAQSVVDVDEPARRRRLSAFRSAAPLWQRPPGLRGSARRSPPRPAFFESAGPVVLEARILSSAPAGSPPDAHARVAQLAERCAEAAADLPSLIEILVAGASRALAYDERAAQAGRPLADALELGRGVCQDYAHLAIAAARALGLTARYVAGYVPPDPDGGPRRRGSMHAWIAIHCPEHGWIHADPTTGTLACDRYVVSAVGGGYWDTAPITGTLSHAAEAPLESSVEIEPCG